MEAYGTRNAAAREESASHRAHMQDFTSFSLSFSLALPLGSRYTILSMIPSARKLHTLVLPGLAVLLFAAVFAIFSPSIRYGFVSLDDTDYVTKNALVLSGLSPRGILGAFSSGLHGGMYMPLLWISYMADVTLFGASACNPAPFHAVNVALHAANAVLFFFLLLRLSHLLAPSILPASPTSRVTRPSSPVHLLPPFLLALLWAVHPLRVESVAWITERKDVLSIFCALLSLVAYLRTAPLPPGPAPSRSMRVLCSSLSLMAFAASLLVKPSLVPLPVLLVLLDLLALRWHLSIRLLLAKLPWFLLSAAAVGSTLVGHADSLPDVPPAVRLARLPQTLAYYIRVSVFPRRLTLFEPDPVFAFLPTVLCALLLAYLLCLAFRYRRSSPLATLGILWFFLFLLPFSGIVPIPNATVVDRFACFPSLGLSVTLLPLFAPGSTPAAVRHTVTALALAAVAVFAFLSLRLLPSWRSSDALYAHIRRFTPDNRFLAVHDFRHAQADSGDYATARAIAERVLAFNPSDIQFVVCLASCIANLDGPQPAFDFLAPRRPPAATFRGEWAWEMATLSLRLGRPGDALSFADLADAALPPHSALRENVARLRTAASSPDPIDALPHYVSQWMVYERADALEFFRRFLAAHPDRPDFLANVAWFLSTSDWSPAPPSEALGYASRALELAGERPPPELLDTYAAALANASDYPAAAAAEEQAIAILPPVSPSLPDYLARLDLYRHSRPYRHDIGIY